jgi:hypothetical protein
VAVTAGAPATAAVTLPAWTSSRGRTTVGTPPGMTSSSSSTSAPGRTQAETAEAPAEEGRMAPVPPATVAGPPPQTWWTAPRAGPPVLIGRQAAVRLLAHRQLVTRPSANGERIPRAAAWSCPLPAASGRRRGQ